jgi:hypothetical protein
MAYAPDCDRPIPASVLRSGAAVWLLSVEVAGRTLRWSSRPVIAGGWHWRGGLPRVEVSQDLDFLQLDPAAPSASVGLIATEEIARWISYGHRLTGAAELSLWVEGTDYDERQVVIRGPMLFGAYGGAGEPMTGTIEPQPQGEGEPLGDTTQTYGAGSVPAASLVEQSLGEAYPLVFGRPYVQRRARAGAATLTTTPFATKGVIYQREASEPTQATRILLCRGHIPDGEAVTLAWEGTADPDDEGSQTFVDREIVRTYDDSGRAVSLINVAFAGLTPAQRQAKAWYVRWDRAVGGTTKSPGAVETVTRRYTSAELPITDETLTTVRSGDAILRSSAQIITGFSGSRTLEVDWISPAVVQLLDLTPTELGSVGTVTGAGGFRVDAASRIRLAATGAAGEALVRVDVRRGPRPGDAITTLGELALWLAERSGQRTDLGAWASLVPLLDVPIGGQLDPARPAWSALLEDVLPLAPISLRTGPAGVVPVLWRWWATSAEAEAQIRVGFDGVVRLPDVTSARPDAEINTGALLRYAWDARAGSYRLGASLSGAAGLPAARVAEVRLHAFATLDSSVSTQIYGERTLRADSRLVYDTSTAAWWCRWRLAAEGWAHRLVQVEGRQQLAHLMPGAVVTLTDPSVFLDGAIALVTGHRLTDTGRVGLRLALVDGWSSTRTTAGPTADAGPTLRPGGPVPDPQQ